MLKSAPFSRSLSQVARQVLRALAEVAVRTGGRGAMGTVRAERRLGWDEVLARLARHLHGEVLFRFFQIKSIHPDGYNLWFSVQ